MQGFTGTQQALMNLVTQFVGLIASQGRGVLEQTFGVADQSLKIIHQDFLSSLCCFAGHGDLHKWRVKGSSMGLALRFSANDWYSFCYVLVRRALRLS
ncbi:hypothetical protein D3C81_1553940 [compost metagenome]